MSEIKHELINGQVYTMTGVTANHQRIGTNLMLFHHPRGSRCEVMGPGMRLRIGDNFFFPDQVVVCDFDESEPRYTQNPVFIVEILSQSGSRIDRTIKRQAYCSLPSLVEYVLIEQGFVDIEVMRKSDDWRSRHYFLEDERYLESIDFTVPVAAIYERVNNPDIVSRQAQ